MPGDRLAAHGVERLDPEGFDVGLAVQAQLPLDGQLDGQAVAIPAGLAIDVEALHGLEAREDVLEDAGLDVMRPRGAVRGGRALVERPGLVPLGVLQGAPERVALVPEREDLALHGGQIDLRGHRAVTRCAHLGGILRELNSNEGTRLLPRGTTLLGWTKIQPARGRPPPVLMGSEMAFGSPCGGLTALSRSSGSSGVMAPSMPCGPDESKSQPPADQMPRFPIRRIPVRVTHGCSVHDGS